MDWMRRSWITPATPASASGAVVVSVQGEASMHLRCSVPARTPQDTRRRHVHAGDLLQCAAASGGQHQQLENISNMIEEMRNASDTKLHLAAAQLGGVSIEPH